MHSLQHVCVCVCDQKLLSHMLLNDEIFFVTSTKPYQKVSCIPIQKSHIRAKATTVASPCLPWCPHYKIPQGDISLLFPPPLAHYSSSSGCCSGTTKKALEVGAVVVGVVAVGLGIYFAYRAWKK